MKINISKKDCGLNINSLPIVIVTEEINMLGYNIPLKKEYDLSKVYESDIEMVLSIIKNL
jgi:hypothetical protein